MVFETVIDYDTVIQAVEDVTLIGETALVYCQFDVGEVVSACYGGGSLINN